MASQGKIDEIIGQEAFKQVELLTDKLNSANEALLNNINSAQQFTNALGGAKSLPAFSKAAQQSQVSLEKLAQAQNRTAITSAQLEAAQARATATTTRLSQAQEKAADKAKAALSPYQQLTKQLRDAEAAAADVGVAFGATSPQFQAAAKGVQGLRAQVDAIEQPIGKFQRNVGNYASVAFGYVRTLANILPGLGISGIFLAAFEGIKYATEQLGLFNSKVTSSQAILKTLNEVNKTASDEYGKQATNLRILYSAATDLNSSMDARLRAARELQREFPTTFKNYTAEKIVTGELTGQYNQLTESLLANAKARAAADKIAELAGKQQEIEFQKIKIRNAEINESRAVTAVTQVSAGANTDALANTYLSADNQRKSIDNQRAVIKARADASLAIQDQNKKILQDQIDFLIKYAGGNNKIADALSQNGGDTPTDTTQKDRLSAISALIEAERTRNQTVQADDQSSYEERLKSSADFVTKETELINRRREIELGAENLTADGRKAIRQTAANDIKKIELDGLKDRQKVDADATKELEQQYQVQMRLASDADKATVASLEAATQERLRLNSKLKDDSLLQLSDQYKRGLISEREYRDAVLIVEEESAKESLQIQLDQLNILIAERKKAGLETADLEARSAAIQAKINDELTKKKIKNDEEYAKLQERQRKELVQKTKEIADALIDLAKTIVDSSYQNQQDDIKNQSDAIDKKAEQDKKDVDRSLLTSEQKADAEALIDAQAQAQKEQLAARSKQLANEQAKADRLFTIAKIIETTALAAISALASPPIGLGPVLGIPLAVAVGALGAVQLATVLATPLPQYAKGTRNAKGGASIVGELGTELVIDPQGRTSLTPNGPTLTYLQPGSQVLTHKETMALMMRPEKLTTAQSGGMGWDAFAKLQEKNTARLEKSMGVKVNTQRITKAGFRGGVAAMSAWNDRKRNYLR